MQYSLRLCSLFSLVLPLLLLASSAHALERGLAWGTTNWWGTKLTGGKYTWYWHWQEGVNPYFKGRLEFVPCFWGPKYASSWSRRKNELAASSTLPKAILAFNEPDIEGQANLSPAAAASLFSKELQPYRRKGVRVSSPQIVWNVDWLDSFIRECGKVGCDVDFIALHWYGAHSDLSHFKAYVEKVYKKFKKPIWLTEYGVTTSGGGTQAQVKQFHIDATTWLDSLSYVERASSFGAFAVTDPPDGFGNSKNALFNADGSLRSLALWYVNSKREDKGMLFATIPKERS